MKRLQRGDKPMQDYYAMYTWVMDKQAETERRAAERRLLRHSRFVNLRLQWPVKGRRDDRPVRPTRHAA